MGAEQSRAVAEVPGHIEGGSNGLISGMISDESREDGMPAYFIYQAEVTDRDQYERYKPLASASITSAGGRYLVRGGAAKMLEGEPPHGRTVILEFPTMQAALDWYHGEEYTEARKLRETAAKARAYVVEGLP